MTPDKIKRFKKISLITTTLLFVVTFCFYKFILYPKHFAEWEVWNVPPKSLPFFMFHENEATELDELFQHLKRNNYKTLNIQETLDIIEGRTLYTGKEVVLTFDDGKLGLWSITAPKMKEYGLKGIAFVNPGFVTHHKELRPQHQNPLSKEDLHNYCSWNELKAMKDFGIEIQSHSYDHKHQDFFYTHDHSKRKDQILESLTKAKTTLTQQGFTSHPLFCAPYGKVSLSLIETANEAGHTTVIGVLPIEPISSFHGPQNDFKHRNFILRYNYRSIYSLPGKGSEGIIGRLWRYLNEGGDRAFMK